MDIVCDFEVANEPLFSLADRENTYICKIKLASQLPIPFDLDFFNAGLLSENVFQRLLYAPAEFRTEILLRVAKYSDSQKFMDDGVLVSIVFSLPEGLSQEEADEKLENIELELIKYFRDWNVLSLAGLSQVLSTSQGEFLWLNFIFQMSTLKGFRGGERVNPFLWIKTNSEVCSFEKEILPKVQGYLMDLVWKCIPIIL